MKLRAFALILTLALGLLAGPMPAEAQKGGKVYRIGVLVPNPRSVAAVFLEAFLQELRDLDWVEGQNLIIEWRFAEGRYERLPNLAVELVRLKVDVIVSITTPGTRATINATRTIPIVFTAVGDPVGSGFVASLARPGGNATRLSFFGPDIVGKQLELLKETVPQASRVAVFWNPTNPAQTPGLREVKVAARSLGVQLQILGVRGPDEFDGTFAAMTREHAEALLVLAEPMFFRHRARLADLAAKHQLPAMHGLRQHVEAGDLMAYAPNMADLFRGAATYVDKILKGANPADLPVEQPTKFELVINLKTANTLGLTIPPSVLIRADRVIK